MPKLFSKSLYGLSVTIKKRIVTVDCRKLSESDTFAVFYCACFLRAGNNSYFSGYDFEVNATNYNELQNLVTQNVKKIFSKTL